MKTRYFITAAAALLLGATASLAQPSYPIFRTGDKITVDGVLGEASWQSAPKLSDLADIRDDKSLPLPTKNTTIKMLWDDTYLYIGAYLEEDEVIATLKGRDVIIYKENDFEVFIDPEGDGQNYYEFEFSAAGEIMDLIMDKPYSVGGNFFMPWDCKGLVVKTHIDGTPNDPAVKDKGWGIEIAIPRASLMRGFEKPTDRSVWRMNFSRVEYLKKQGPEENWVWAPTGKVDIHIPAKWGYVMFVDVPATSLSKEKGK